MNSEAEKLAMALLTGQVRDMSALAPDPELENSVFYGEQSPWNDYSGEALPALDPIDLSVAGDAIAAGQAVTNRDPLALALAALSVGLPGTIRPVSGLQAYAEVLPKSVRLAQMRVVEPLGGIGTDAAEVAISDAAREAAAKQALDMSTEARMARAAEQGFLPETLFHGTKHNFKEFSLTPGNQFGEMYSKPAIFSTSDPSLAALYAMNGPHPEEQALIFARSKLEKEWKNIETKLARGSDMSLDEWLDIPEVDRHGYLSRSVKDGIITKDEESRWLELRDELSDLQGELNDAQWKHTEANDRAINANIIPLKVRASNPLKIDADGRDYFDVIPPNIAKLENHDLLIFDNIIDSPTGAQDNLASVYVTRSPEQLRSIFAAFDPAKKDSADLLAGIAPLAAPTALAAALSQLGADSLSSE